MRQRSEKETKLLAYLRSHSRLRTLHAYMAADALTGVPFDDLVRTAAVVCATPIAGVSLLDDQRQWFTSVVGLPIKQTDVATSFCRYTIAQNEVFEVPDTHVHSQLQHSPLVTGELGIRFYAGYPLITPEGEAIGTLMVADRVPRKLTSEQSHSLKLLAQHTVAIFVLNRQHNRVRARLREQAHYHSALHELAEQGGAVGYWGRQVTQKKLFLTPEAWTLLGMRPQEVCTDQELLQSIAGSDQEKWEHALAQCEDNGSPMEIECRWQRGGEFRTVRWLAVRVEENVDAESRIFGMVIDVTDRRKRDQDAKRIQDRFQVVAELTSDALWEWDLPTHTMWWSEGMERLFGYPAVDCFPADNTRALVHADDQPELERSLWTAIASESEEWSRTYRLMRVDGSFAWVDSRARIIRGPQKEALRLVGILTDISERVHQREEREKDVARLKEQAMLLDQARDAIVVKDLHHRIQFWNTGAELLYGWKREEVLGHHAPTVLHEDPELIRQLEQQLYACDEFQHDIIQQHKSGHPIDTRVHWTLVRDENGKPHAIFAIASDITQSRRDREHIQNLAFYDQLTRLPNRTLLTERLTHAVVASVRHHQHGVLMFLDLDNFKSLNDTLGHAQGDDLLKQVGARLRSCVRGVDTVARLGGDEFVVLLEELGEDATHAVWQAEAVAVKILEQLRHPFTLGLHTHLCTASIGVTLFWGRERGIDELLKQADIAMYEAKAAGRNTVRFFDPQMQQVVIERMHLENDLRLAALREEFILYYQPQWNRDGSLSGMEALLRWKHPKRGLLQPKEFLSVAEDSDFVLTLGRWVMRQACHQLADWHRSGKLIRVAVNISALQLQSDELVKDVHSALTDSGAPPSYLSLEITESMLTKDLDAAVLTICRIKEMGVRFALDDFGTGYSSLSVLERLPIDDLKIDLSFVHRLEQGGRNNQMVESIVKLGKILDLNIIAEGVETEKQLALLQEYGCDEFQGFLRGRSMSVADIAHNFFFEETSSK